LEKDLAPILAKKVPSSDSQQVKRLSVKKRTIIMQQEEEKARAKSQLEEQKGLIQVLESNVHSPTLKLTREEYERQYAGSVQRGIRTAINN